MRSKIKKVLIIIFWVAVWAGIAAIVSRPIILAGPIEVFNSASKIIITTDFWLTILVSFIHIIIGFIIACILGTLFGILSYKFKTFNEFINPLMQLAKSAPIVCFIVLLLVWFGAEIVDIITVIIAVTPVYFFAIYEACINRNIKTHNMLKIYQVPYKVIFRVFEWPNVLPYFNQATKTGIGLSWKSAVTAQMIGAVAYTIGEGVYTSKMQLDSAQVLLWMFVVVILGWICEKIIISIINFFTKKSYHKIKKTNIKKYNEVDKPQANIVIGNITKSFNNKKVLDNFTQKIDSGSKILISGPTGIGKTTLINIILEIIKPDSGEIFIEQYKPRNFSVVFQENTLLDQLTVDENILICSNKKTSNQLVHGSILAKDLSGGMKRCAEIQRAIMADSQIVIMDEPFAGLDEKTKSDAIKFINENLNDRTLIIISHEENDAKPLDCKVIKI